MTFPERIAAIRKELKLSQEKFGELANVSQRTVAFWESGERMPSHSTISALADRLGISVDYLLGRSDSKKDAKEKQPAAHDGELLENIISRILTLPDPDRSRVADFLDELEAAQGNPTAAPADPDPAGEPAG